MRCCNIQAVVDTPMTETSVVEQQPTRRQTHTRTQLKVWKMQRRERAETLEFALGNTGEGKGLGGWDRVGQQTECVLTVWQLNWLKALQAGVLRHSPGSLSVHPNCDTPLSPLLPTPHTPFTAAFAGSIDNT